MPFVLFLLGVLFLIVAVRGTQGQFFDLIKSEFTGTNNFLIWILAIVILGMIGYLKPVRPIAHAFIGLIILVMIVANKGIFAKFNDAFRNPTAVDPPANQTAATGAPAPAAATGTTPTGGAQFGQPGTASQFGGPFAYALSGQSITDATGGKVTAKTAMMYMG